MPVRSSDAVWNGGLRGGTGSVKFESGAFQGQYSFSSRFESGVGTNPEELIAAAHAGCFSMALAASLEAAGYKPVSVHTVARVHIDKVGDGFSITQIELDTEAEVPGIDTKAFLEHAQQTKVGCPVSGALASVDMVLSAKLLDS